MNETVVSKECEKRFQPIVDDIKRLLDSEKKVLIVSIDGMSAAGKSTLGYYLQQTFDSNLFHMDDFFLEKEKRTSERMSQIAGNIDYERFYNEVLKPVIEEGRIVYRLYSCKTGEYEEERVIDNKRLNIVEGSYSNHPYFGEAYDLRIFMEISSELQINRIRTRNGEEGLKGFINEWIPREERYFKNCKIKENSRVLNNTPT